MDVQIPTLDGPKAIAIAGLMGSLLSLSFIDGMTVKQRVVAVFSGVVMAHYVAPLIAFLFNAGQYIETIGFLVGLFGMSIVAACFRAIKNSDLWELLRSRFSTASVNKTTSEGEK